MTRTWNAPTKRWYWKSLLCQFFLQYYWFSKLYNICWLIILLTGFTFKYFYNIRLIQTSILQSLWEINVKSIFSIVLFTNCFTARMITNSCIWCAKWNVPYPYLSVFLSVFQPVLESCFHSQSPSQFLCSILTMSTQRSITNLDIQWTAWCEEKNSLSHTLSPISLSLTHTHTRSNAYIFSDSLSHTFSVETTLCHARDRKRKREKKRDGGVRVRISLYPRPDLYPKKPVLVVVEGSSIAVIFSSWELNSSRIKRSKPGSSSSRWDSSSHRRLATALLAAVAWRGLTAHVIGLREVPRCCGHTSGSHPTGKKEFGLRTSGRPEENS